jgi:hypothetical protein
MVRRRFLDNDVARQEQPGLGTGRERLVRQRWIACAEDHVGAELLADLLLEGRVDVRARVSTPKPSAFSAAVTRSTAPAKDAASSTSKLKLLMVSALVGMSLGE